jgi:acyl carrier protein
VLHTPFGADKDERSGMQGDPEPQRVEELELEIKQMIVRAAKLTATRPEDIDSDLALFEEGMGLDSLDAIQIGIALEKTYGVGLGADEEENRRRLASVRSIAALIRPAAPRGSAG